MSTTLNNNFREWYRTVDPGPTEQVLKFREDGLQVLMKKTSKDFWLDVVRIYCRYPTKDIVNLEKFIESFTSVDTDFPKESNTNLLHCLAGIALCFRLQNESAKYNNLIALAIINTLFINKSVNTTDIPVFHACQNFLSGISIRERKVQTDEIFERTATATQLLNENQFDVAKTYKDFTITVLDDLRTLTINQKSLTEETNVLWWLFGGYSLVEGKFFDECDYQKLLLAAPMELANLTEFSNPFASSKSIINRVLNSSRNRVEIRNNISLKDVLEQAKQYISSDFTAIPCEEIVEFTPCISYLRNINSKMSIKDNYNLELDVNEIANQIYREIILTRLINL
jgi:hypothetical protein